MKYCEETTTNHPVCMYHAKEIELLNAIFQTEGCKKKLFQDEKALNLDKVEIVRCKGKKNRVPTMDLAIGISKEGKNKHMLLVELKFGVGNPKNIKKKDIEDKVNHSISLLSYSLPILRNKIFIFRDDKKSEARSHINRLFNNKPNLDILVLTAQEFKVTYF